MRFDPTAVDRARLALLLRGRAEGLDSEERTSLAKLSKELKRLAASPTSWPDLDQQWISLLAFHQLLSRGASEDPQRLADTVFLFKHVVSVPGTHARLTLEDEIAQQRDGS